MNSLRACQEIVEFVWQYEHRKRWHNFSDEDLRNINECIKQGHHSTTIPTKKQWKLVTINLNKMCQIYDTCHYEQRIRCLISDTDFYAWLYRNEKNDWVSFNPQLAFLLEVALRKKEVKLCFLDYEFNLEKFELIISGTEVCQPIKREKVETTVSSQIKTMIQRNELVFKKACSQEFSRIKRSLEVSSNASNDTGPQTKKKRRAVTSITTVEEEIIQPVNGVPEVQVSLSRNTTAENEHFLNSVPVDAECSVKQDFHVYTKGTAFSATLNQTNLQNNNNKFYIIQLLEHNARKQYCVWRRWGRVGQRGQTNLNKYGTSISEAKDEFEGKFYDKTRNYWSDAKKFVHVKGKYDLLHINLAPKEETKKLHGKSRLVDEVKALMELICDTQRMEEIMKEFSYDSNKTPLGQLTLLQVKSGYVALNKIASILHCGGSHSELLNACNDFYTKIPHNFGMKTPPIIKTPAEIELKQKMLEALTNIRIAMNVMNTENTTVEHPLDIYYKTLNCSLDLLESDCPEYMAIEKCLQETHGPTHRTYKMEIINIFKCLKPGEETLFEDYDNKLILWHGSRIVNWLGILKDGLRIAPPEAPSTGYMFGKGIYFADVSSKSANYCFATKKKNEGLLLMCEVAVGKQFPLIEADEDMPDNLPPDFNSVHGKGRVFPTDFQLGPLSSEAKVPKGPLVENKTHEGSLHYNEYIVYNTKQVKMKYLIRIKFKFE